jgi:dihydroorotate dehydrogenase electron transfer subunit
MASLIGPLGNGFTISPHLGRRHFLIAGGTGIASVLLLAKELLQKGDEVHLLYGGRSREDLIGLEDFEQLGARILVTTDDGSYGLKGLVTDALRQCMEQFEPDDLNFFACGPMAMMQTVAELAQARDIPCQISVEVKMACGFGVCLGCSVKTVQGYRLSCTHGPVFDVAQFLWEPPWHESQGLRKRESC